MSEGEEGECGRWDCSVRLWRVGPLAGICFRGDGIPAISGYVEERDLSQQTCYYDVTPVFPLDFGHMTHLVSADLRIGAIIMTYLRLLRSRTVLRTDMTIAGGLAAIRVMQHIKIQTISFCAIPTVNSESCYSSPTHTHFCRVAA